MPNDQQNNNSSADDQDISFGTARPSTQAPPAASRDDKDVSFGTARPSIRTPDESPQTSALYRGLVEGPLRAVGNAASAVHQAASDLSDRDTPVFLSNNPEDQGSLADRMQGDDTMAEHFLFGPAAHEKQRALEEAQAFHDTHGLDAAGHAISSMAHTGAEFLPLFGPAAASIGERIGSGDIAGGIGEGATYALLPKMVRKGGEVLGKTYDATAGKVGLERPSVRGFGNFVGKGAGSFANWLEKIRSGPKPPASPTPSVPIDEINLPPEPKQLDARSERLLQNIERQSMNNPVRRPGDVTQGQNVPPTKEEPLFTSQRTPVVRGGSQELPGGGVMGKPLQLGAAPPTPEPPSNALDKTSSPQQRNASKEPVAESDAAQRALHNRIGEYATSKLQSNPEGADVINTLKNGTNPQYADLANKEGIPKPQYLVARTGKQWVAEDLQRSVAAHGKSISPAKEIVVRYLVDKYKPSEITKRTSGWGKK